MNDAINWIGQNVPPWLYIAVIIHLTSLGMVAYLILLERKVASWVQDRIGPNRVGLGFGIIPGLKDMKMFGLGQPMADGLKFFFKEDYRPKSVDKILFSLAPMIMITVVIVSIAVIPWGGTKAVAHEVNVTAARLNGSGDAALAALAIERADLPWYTSVLGDPVVRQAPAGGGLSDMAGNKTVVDFNSGWRFMIAPVGIGVLFVLSTLSLAVYGVVIGGWASNNKFSFLGGLRATANMISYEIPLGLAILTVVVMFGTMDLTQIVDNQARYWWGVIPAWNVFAQPLAFVLFLICIHAEANRAPFDLAEAEQELVGGYHTEYSSMRFALFFLSEYAGMITTSCVCVALFFGGWHLPGLHSLVTLIVGQTHPAGTNAGVTTSFLECILRTAVFFAKAWVVLFTFMWVRWSLPRFRFDQLMRLAWGALVPIGIVLLLGTAVVVWLTGGQSMDEMNGLTMLAFLAMNIVVAAMLLGLRMIQPTKRLENQRLPIAGSRFSPATAV